MPLELSQEMNAASYFVDKNVDEGRGEKVAVIDTSNGTTYTYGQVQEFREPVR